MGQSVSTLICFAHGRDREWEALCVDFDLAVQGASFDEVKALLDDAIGSYIVDARAEAPGVARQLLNRRAPWHVRTMLTMKLIAFNLSRGRTSEAQASFPVLCPG